MRAAALLLALGGCDQLFQLDRLPPADPQSEVDAALGTIVDAPSSCLGGTFVGKYGAGGTGLLHVCVPANIPPLVDLPSMIDTSLASQCDAVVVIDSFGTEACVKWAGAIRAASVQATGPRALVLVATDSITVTGTIDVSSTRTNTKGAGGNWGGCQANSGIDGTTLSSGGGSGGAGGSFSTRGGSGGANGTGGFTGARAAAAVDRIRGGCEGGEGGLGPSSLGGVKGRAGGGVYFTAGSSLQFSSTAIVNASGAAGRGGAGEPSLAYAGGGGGGGGGGSGGLIGLDSPLIVVASEAKLFANGGGGGGGGASTGMGVTGLDPSSDTIMTPATGGGGAATYGGKGGAGAAGTTSGYAGGQSKSGGGGGGGLGYIVTFTTGPPVAAGKFSPPPLPM